MVFYTSSESRFCAYEKPLLNHVRTADEVYSSTIEIFGSNFVDTGIIKVRFNALDSEAQTVHEVNASFISESCIECIPGNKHTPGSLVSVAIALNGQQYVSETISGNKEDHITFSLFKRPVVKSIYPRSGSPTGGTLVSLMGDNFVETGQILVRLVSNTPRTFVRDVNGFYKDGCIWFHMPSFTETFAPVEQESLGLTDARIVDSPKSVTVNLCVHGGMSFKAQNAKRDAMQYDLHPLASILHLNPGNGPLFGGTRLSVIGTGFVDTKTIVVKFETAIETHLVGATFVSHTAIFCTVPSFANEGRALVTVAMNGVDFCFSDLKYVLWRDWFTKPKDLPQSSPRIPLEEHATQEAARAIRRARLKLNTFSDKLNIYGGALADGKTHVSKRIAEENETVFWDLEGIVSKDKLAQRSQRARHRQVGLANRRTVNPLGFLDSNPFQKDAVAYFKHRKRALSFAGKLDLCWEWRAFSALEDAASVVPLRMSSSLPVTRRESFWCVDSHVSLMQSSQDRTNVLESSLWARISCGSDKFVRGMERWKSYHLLTQDVNTVWKKTKQLECEDMQSGEWAKISVRLRTRAWLVGTALVEQSDIFVTDSSSERAMKRVRALSVAGRKRPRGSSLVGGQDESQGGVNIKNGWRMWCIRGTRHTVKKTIAQLGIKKAVGSRMLLPISMADFVRYLASENHTSRRRHVTVGGDPTRRFLDYFGVDLDAVKDEDVFRETEERPQRDCVDGEEGDDIEGVAQMEKNKSKSMIDDIIAHFHDPNLAAETRGELLQAFEDEDSFFSGLTDFEIFQNIFKSHFGTF